MNEPRECMCMVTREWLLEEKSAHQEQLDRYVQDEDETDEQAEKWRKWLRSWIAVLDELITRRESVEGEVVVDGNLSAVFDNTTNTAIIGITAPDTRAGFDRFDELYGPVTARISRHEVK